MADRRVRVWIVAAGGVIWLGLLAVPMPLEVRLFLLAPLVTVPLGLTLADTPDRHGRRSTWWRAAAWLQVPAAVATSVSFVVWPAPGTAAVVCAAPWFVVTLLMAGFGVIRFLTRGPGPACELAVDAGLVYSAVGGGWLLLARAGWHVGFEPIIVMLTAVHFHFAGFAGHLIAGGVGRLLPADQPRLRRVHATAVGLFIGAMIVVATGITLDAGPIELTGTAMLYAAMLLLAGVIFTQMPTRRDLPALATFTLVLAAVGILVSMAFAGAYSYGRAFNVETLSIPGMIELHGAINALGFSLLGLLALVAVRPQPQGPAVGVPVSKLRGRLQATGADWFTRCGAVPPDVATPTGLFDSLEVFRRDDFDPDLLHPEVRGFYERTADYQLCVNARWRPLFGLAGRLFSWFGARIGQVHLPAGRPRWRTLRTTLHPLSANRDGRIEPRASVRVFEDNGRPMYVAAYARHERAGIPYLNVAFPWPLGSFSSAMLPQLVPDESGAGICLTTAQRARPVATRGLFVVTPWLTIRLPIEQDLNVIPADPDAATEIMGALPDAEQPRCRAVALQRVRVLGIPVVELRYALTRPDAP